MSLSTVSSKAASSSPVQKGRRQNWHVFFPRDLSLNFSYMCFALSVIDKSLRAKATCSCCAAKRAAKSALASPSAAAGGAPSSPASRCSSSRSFWRSASAERRVAAAKFSRWWASWHFCRWRCNCSSAFCDSARTLATASDASGICPKSPTRRGRASPSFCPSSASASRTRRRNASTSTWASLCASSCATSLLFRVTEYWRS
mmetsp:Transcript_3168/g.6737  ORF Transcript_3168/g.6737 Transcript_3168/m.6737 type:complete len:202 (-) Transcript_3168:1585-2190(-)